MNTLWQDVRYSLRMLAKNPGFAAVAVLALALGIGVNTVIFSYVNAVMYRILTFPQPDRVAFVWSANRASGGGIENPVSAPDFTDWRAQARSFEGLNAITYSSRTLSGAGEPEVIGSLHVTTNFFQDLGIRPAFGRAFLPEESQPGANRVVVLSHGFWQRRFGSDPGVIGQTITLDGERYTMIGIMPADFKFVFGSDLWEPLVLETRPMDRNRRFLTVFGRLNPGVTTEQAEAEMENIAGRIAQQFPETSAGWSAHVMTAAEVLLRRDGRMAMALLTGVVFAVLLIACANIASLQLTRAAVRQKEIAIRLALGASRFRLVRQLLTENLLLALGGGGCGLLLAMWGMSLVQARYVGVMPFLSEAVIDWRVLGYTMLLAFASALIFGLWPALRASQPDLHESLKEGGRSGAGSRRTSRARNALVVAEISLALMLLVVAGLLIRTIIAFQMIEPGFDPENLLTMNVSLPEREYSTDPQTRQFFERILSQLASQPGVRSVGGVSRLPLAGSSRNPRRSITIEGKPAMAANDQPWTIDLTVTPGYFDAIGIPLLTGRQLSAQDTADSPRVAIISQTMARKYWADGDPLGKRFRFESSATTPSASFEWITIAGVVGDVRNDDADEPPLPQVYLPHAQNPLREMSLLVRTAGAGDPLGFISVVRTAIREIDTNLPVYDVATMERLLYDDLAGVRILVELMTAFAALALVLAAVGIYGVMSHNVAQRINEIGIRMALGARGSDVLKLIIGQGVKLVIAGVVIGVAGALALSRVMASLIYGVSATDPLTFIAISLLLVSVALLACYIPARRATKVDPMVALRYE